MDEDTDGFYAKWFARRWTAECKKFQEYTTGTIHGTDGIWKPMSKWRKRYEKRKNTCRSAKYANGGNAGE
jgi:hypothetical protein